MKHEAKMGQLAEGFVNLCNRGAEPLAQDDHTANRWQVGA